MFRHGDGTTANSSGMDHNARHTCRNGGRPPALSPRDGPRLAQDGQNISRLEIEEFLLGRKKFEVRQIDERYFL